MIDPPRHEWMEEAVVVDSVRVCEARLAQSVERKTLNLKRLLILWSWVRAPRWATTMM
uniref:Uncharacterized protein n=1 Tax=Peronospora matthiolae TaxID=2874970 RepID=A0AAV1U4Q5_9STRA